MGETGQVNETASTLVSPIAYLGEEGVELCSTGQPRAAIPTRASGPGAGEALYSCLPSGLNPERTALKKEGVE